MQGNNAQTNTPNPTKTPFDINERVTQIFQTHFPDGTPFMECVTGTSAPTLTPSVTPGSYETLIPDRAIDADWLEECGYTLPTKTPMFQDIDIADLECSGVVLATNPPIYGNVTPTATLTNTPNPSITPTLTPTPQALDFYDFTVNWDHEDFIGLTGSNRTVYKDIGYGSGGNATIAIRLGDLPTISSSYIQRQFINGGQAEIWFDISITTGISPNPKELMYPHYLTSNTYNHTLSWAHIYNLFGYNSGSAEVMNFGDTVAHPAAATNLNWSIDYDDNICVDTLTTACNWHIAYTTTPDTLRYRVTSNAKSGTSTTRFFDASLQFTALLPIPPGEVTPSPTPLPSNTPVNTSTPSGTDEPIDCNIPQYEDEQIVTGGITEIVVIGVECYVVIPGIDFTALDFSIDLPEVNILGTNILPDTIGFEDVNLFDSQIQQTELCVTWIEFPSFSIFGISLPLDWFLVAAVAWFIGILLVF